MYCHSVNIGENIGAVVQISFLSCLQAGILCVSVLVPVWWPPSWISHFRFGRKLWQPLPLEMVEPRKHRFSRWGCVPILPIHAAEIICVSILDSGLEAALLIFYFRSGQTAFRMDTVFQDLAFQRCLTYYIHSLRHKSEKVGNTPSS